MQRILTEKLNEAITKSLPDSECLSFKMDSFDRTNENPSVAEVLVYQKSDGKAEYSTKVVKFNFDVSVSNVDIQDNPGLGKMTCPEKMERYHIRKALAFSGTRANGENIVLPFKPVLGRGILYNGDMLFAWITTDENGNKKVSNYIAMPSSELGHVQKLQTQDGQTFYNLANYQFYAYQAKNDDVKLSYDGYEVIVKKGSWVLYPIDTIFFEPHLATIVDDKDFQTLFINSKEEEKLEVIEAPKEEGQSEEAPAE